MERGRFTAGMEGSFAVFIFGIRVNRLRAVGRWLPVLRALRGVLRELHGHRGRGFFGAETFFYWRGVAVVQYWRSREDLERFARDPEDVHLPAWRKFNREVRKSGVVGVWHEAYAVEDGRYEAVYANMPPFGLARATGRVPAVGGGKGARRRTRGGEEG